MASLVVTWMPSSNLWRPKTQTFGQIYHILLPGKAYYSSQVLCDREEVGHGTIHPAVSFDPDADAAALRKAMKKFGTDEKTIIDILVHRSNDQRQEIRRRFKVLYDKDLISELKSVLSFNLKHTVLAMMEPKALYLAQCLHKAMQGIGTDKKCLIEILCSHTYSEIHAIKQMYKSEFGKDLKKDVADGTSGPFKRLMVSLIRGGRVESEQVDEVKAAKEARELYESKEMWATEESNFIQMFTVRSFPQLKATFDKYLEISGHDILHSVEHELSGDLKEAVKAIIECAHSCNNLFADRLYESMKGLGTDNNTLIRIVVSRSEVDLDDIKKAFFERYKTTLSKMIEGGTSGSYRRLLLAIVGSSATKESGTEDLPHSCQYAHADTEVLWVNLDEEEVGQGTVHPAANFDPEADTTDLRKAIKGFGTDENTIIDILVHRSNDQRQEIRRRFKVLYDEDLVSELKSELSFNLEHTVLAMMEPKALYLAQCLHEAMQGSRTDEKCLIEILCSHTYSEIHAIKQAYKSKFGKDLKKDIADGTSGPFKSLMVSLSREARIESEQVDEVKAAKEARELYESKETWATEESSFIKTLTVRSFPQLKATFDKYFEISQHDILDSIEHELSGDLRGGVKAIVACAHSRHDFFADELYKSTKGAGTDENTLTRIVVSRSEVDLDDIKKAFFERYKTTLSKMIEEDTSGDYQRLLLAIVGNHD